jgi:hypothetical protein
VKKSVVCNTNEILHQLLLFLMGGRSSKPRVLSKLNSPKPTLFICCGQGPDIIPSTSDKVKIASSQTIGTLAEFFMNSCFDIRSEMYR